MLKLTSVKPNFNYAAFISLVSLFLFSNCSTATPIQPVTAEASSSLSLVHDTKLQAESDALLPLFDRMPPVPVFLRDEPVIKTGTNTERGYAYTHCFGQKFPTIFVKKTFYQKNNRKQLINVLKHELTHAWLCRQQMMSGHDARFYKKFAQVGGIGN